MNERSKVDTIVLGAGLTGLVTAFYLRRSGKRVLVIEKNNRIGGVIQTHQKNGFTFESGPNTGVIGQPEAAELFEDLGTDCQLELADERASKRLIWKGDQWHALPSSLSSAISTPLFSTKDKLRILGEPFRPAGQNPDEKLSELVKRRMGKSFLEYAVDPFILGIYAGDPDYLVPKYALPKLYNLEQTYGSFIGGAIKKKFEKTDDRQKKANRKIFSAEGGLSSLTQAMVKTIGPENILLSAKDIIVSKNESGYKVSYTQKEKTCHLASKHVVTTMGSHALHDVFDFASEDALAKIDNLEYAKVVQVALGFNRWEGVPLDAFGGLVPFHENRDILGVLYISSFLKNRAPNEGALLSIFLGGYRKPHVHDLNDEEITQLVEKEMTQMMKVKRFEPDMLEIFRYAHAIPQYSSNSKTRFEAIDQFEEQNPGIHIGGNLKQGIGMADRIKQGKEIAQRIIAQLE
jgi:oxygen-dependent protoporphyrinogen oxidase